MPPASPFSARIAVYALTRQGLDLALRIAGACGGDVFAASSLRDAARVCDLEPVFFTRLADQARATFSRYEGHIFVAAAGIVVRVIAPLLVSKTSDPAVLVADQRGAFVISLLSGHLGGANALAQAVAEAIGAVPVITTATDVEGLPALDSLAKERGLAIGNPPAIRAVNAALVAGEPVAICDPEDRLGLRGGPWEEFFVFMADEAILESEQGRKQGLPRAETCQGFCGVKQSSFPYESGTCTPQGPETSAAPAFRPTPVAMRKGFFPLSRGLHLDPRFFLARDYRQSPCAPDKVLPGNPVCGEGCPGGGFWEKQRELAAVLVTERTERETPPRQTLLILHPRTLCAGIGCRRGTSAAVIESFVRETFAAARLSLASLACLASAAIKEDESGLHEAARRLGVPLRFFPPEVLEKFPVSAPSPKAMETFGLKGICEPAALAAACEETYGGALPRGDAEAPWQGGRATLLVSKRVGEGVTCAVARAGLTERG